MAVEDPLLALDRFPARAFLAGLARGHRPVRPAPSVVESYHEKVVARWAGLLGVAAEDLVICAEGTEALRLPASALLAPGDIALLAEPAPLGLPATVLSVGARYVDVGRLQGGAIPPAALRAALRRHPRAVFWAGAPALSGSDDLLAALDLAGPAPRAILQDGRLHGSLLGAGAPDTGALARVVTLRDPGDPRAPLLHAVVCAAGGGRSLAAVRGPVSLPLALLRLALAALDILARRPAELEARHRTRLDDVRRHLLGAIPRRAGVQVLAAAGHGHAVRCLAGDGAELAGQLQRAGWSAAALSAHPGQGWVWIDLAASPAAGLDGA